MHKIPRKFRDIPEAKRLREAQAHFEAAVEREEVLSKASGQQVYLVSAYLQRAQEELKEAQHAFDAATGLPKIVPVTSAALDEIAKMFAPEQHQEIISLLEKRCGRTIPFMREATARELEPYRLSVLRRSEGDIGELRKWIEFANIEGWDVLI
jgi:hypothetical protein